MLLHLRRYCGTTEWRNAIVFWVNIGGADYANLFLKGGAEMTWFGGSKQTTDTPVIKRILALSSSAANADTRSSTAVTAAAAAAAAGDSSSTTAASAAATAAADSKDSSATAAAQAQQDDCTLLLMCRKPNEPYVFCGRLAQLEVNTTASPLEVRWQLLDFVALQQAPQFLDLLGAAAVPDSSE
jgi:hypothetical protein